MTTQSTTSNYSLEKIWFTHWSEAHQEACWKHVKSCLAMKELQNVASQCGCNNESIIKILSANCNFTFLDIFILLINFCCFFTINLYFFFLFIKRYLQNLGQGHVVRFLIIQIEYLRPFQSNLCLNPNLT